MHLCLFGLPGSGGGLDDSLQATLRFTPVTFLEPGIRLGQIKGTEPLVKALAGLGELIRVVLDRACEATGFAAFGQVAIGGSQLLAVVQAIEKLLRAKVLPGLGQEFTSALGAYLLAEIGLL